MLIIQLWMIIAELIFQLSKQTDISLFPQEREFCDRSEFRVDVQYMMMTMIN